MEEHLKYFVPEISDICVGYELEIRQANKWLSHKIQSNDCFCDFIDMDGYRVPYLTKEQIEAEGWKIAAKDSFTPLFRKSNFTLGYREEDNKLKIQTFGENSYTLYYGKCKCINDLRKIIKLLGI